MNKTELIYLAKVLAEEYLAKDVCDKLMEEFVMSFDSPNGYMDKEFLHILTKRKIKPFDKKSSEQVKILAHELGI